MLPPLRRCTTRLTGLTYSLAALVLLAACESPASPASDLTGAAGGALSRSGITSPPRPPVLEARAPLYPPLAIYIVYREYVHLHPNLTTLSPDDRQYQHYMEKRLRELYPDQGYAGMMRDALAEARRNRQAVEQYMRDLRDYEQNSLGMDMFSSTTMSTCGSTYVDPNAGADASWTGQDEFAVPPDEQLPTIQMEIDSLQLVGPEVDDIYYYESLAKGTYSGGGGGGGGTGEPVLIESVDGEPTRDNLIRAAAAGYKPGEMTAQTNPVLIGSIALGVVAAWKTYRVVQAEARAHQKSTALFPNVDPQDTRRDAHRHIYVNMMLRRYVGATAGKIIMDRYEDQNGSFGPARVMDLHNNDIGRSHRYNAFRGHWLWDRWDWNEWALKVRNYINDEPANGEYIHEWSTDPRPTLEQAWAREACVADARYIYFSQKLI